MIRVGKPMAPHTFVVYVGTQLVEAVFALSFTDAVKWARRAYGDSAYVMENVQARDIRGEVSR